MKHRKIKKKAELKVRPGSRRGRIMEQSPKNKISRGNSENLAGSSRKDISSSKVVDGLDCRQTAARSDNRSRDNRSSRDRKLGYQHLVDKHVQYGVRECVSLDGYPVIEGYDFENGADLRGILKSFATTGFQATNLALAIDTIRTMRREKAVIFLAYTSNMVSSGVREVISYLVRQKVVDLLVTAAGGVEEDVIKTLKPMVLGRFEAPGSMLFEHGINRTGNIFVPNDRFAYFEKFMQPFFTKELEKQKKLGRPLCPSELISDLGWYVEDKSSILYWASRNDIKVFCPGIIDGSLGDLLYFFKQSHSEFVLDVSLEMKKIVDIVLGSKKTGGIILGGGISKHFALNANIFKEGFDYVVYVNTAQEFDGSDSGARIDEAVSWGKVKKQAVAVKVHCDATIAFPLIVAGLVDGEKNG